MSGIWKGHDYRLPHFERLPYNADTVRSAYHIREVDVRKLLQVRTQVDIGISHDWPQGIEWAGNYQGLFRKKPFFVEDAESGRLGSSAARYVLDRLRPAQWYSAHLHVGYTATLEHTTYVPPRVVHARKFTTQAQQPPMRDPALASEFERNKAPEVQAPVQESQARAAEATIDPSEATAPIDQSGGSEKDRLNAWRGFYEVASKKEAQENAEYLKNADEFRRKVEAGEIEKPTSNIEYQMTWKKVVTDDGLSREVTDVVKTTSGSTENSKLETKSVPAVKNADEIDIDMESSSDSGENLQDMPDAPALNEASVTETNLPSVPITPHVDGVSDELRSQLPASFQRPAQSQQLVAVEETLPEGITNKTTHFLALDKCLPSRRFLELMELSSISESDGANELRPYQLKYDKEWLAINRVFAKGFEVGNKVAHFPQDEGHASYKPRIIEAEAWVEENIVQKGKLTIPQNFTITAPVYDPAVPITTREQPFEYANPQTAQFCSLIGIANPFQQTEEQERQQQEAIIQHNANPPPPRSYGTGFNRRSRGHPYGREDSGRSGYGDQGGCGGHGEHNSGHGRRGRGRGGGRGGWRGSRSRGRGGM